MIPVSPQLRLHRLLPSLLLLAACRDQPTASPEPQPEPQPVPRVVGVYEVTVTGIGTSNARASVAAVPGRPQESLSAVGSGLSFETMSTNTVTHGTRGQGGQRYFAARFRVRNMTGAALNNLTLIAVSQTATIPGTPYSTFLRNDGTPADSALASQLVPAGAVTIDDEGALQSTHVDVLQVFEEGEVAGIPLPAGTTGIFPYGYVVRNPATPGSRTLPPTLNTNDFSGVFTFSFRYPLQTPSTADPWTVGVRLLAVEDTETRTTETIEEGQDTSAVRQIHQRAAALGATTVTVLAGSPAVDPAMADYPGQRQICSVRTAGTAGAPVTFITNPAAYTRIQVLRPGETADACGAYFKTGAAQRAAFNLPYLLALRQTDLYGNVKTAPADTVKLESLSGPTATLPAPAAFVSGVRQFTVTYTDYGTSRLRAVGRRNRGAQSVAVTGITRTWDGDVSTDWGTAGNWVQNSAPGGQDSVVIPASRPFYPVLTAHTSIGGVTVQDGATLNLGAFDLTATASVWTGTSSSEITSTTGVLVLAGIGQTLQGTLPRMRVTGTYSLSANVFARSSLDVDRGRLTDSGWLLDARSF